MKKVVRYGGLALVLVVGAFAYPYLRFGFYSSAMTAPAHDIQVIGHRGAAALAPENTMAALRMAMETADVIELDVHLTADDSILVMHDATVDRTTDGTGVIADLKYADIAALDAGSWFSDAFKGERVPTLAQVLDMVNGQRTVLIELKWPRNGIYKNLVTRVVELIRERKAESWVIVQSFEYAYLHELRQLAPEITCYQLLYGYISFPPVYMNRGFQLGSYPIVEGAKGLAINYKFLSPALVEKFRNQGWKVVAWTVNDPADMRRVINLGVDAVISDNPGLVRSEIGIVR